MIHEAIKVTIWVEGYKRDATRRVLLNSRATGMNHKQMYEALKGYEKLIVVQGWTKVSPNDVLWENCTGERMELGLYWDD